MTVLTVLRGLPASGKSTYAQKWVAEDTSTRTRVNRDDIRFMLYGNPEYTFDQEQIVSSVEEKAVVSALKAGRDVVVDAMHLRPKYVKKWLDIAQKYKAATEVIEFPCTLEESIERDSARERSVGESVIRNQYNKFTRKGKFLPVLGSDDSEERKASWDPYEAPENVPEAIIVDIDGTVAINTGRSFYDMERVYEDAPNDSVIRAVRAAADNGMQVVYCSGRSDDSYVPTLTWIRKNIGVDGPLFMRKEGDSRRDDIVKYELFNENIRGNFDVKWSYDDRDQVVKMWRALGIPCFQVAPGDF